MRPAATAGFSLPELLIAATLVLIAAGLAAPLTAASIDSGRARHAASFLAARMRLARQQAVATGRTTALVFDEIGGRWAIRICQDGDRDGVRRGDLTAGRDVCLEGPYHVDDLFGGVQLVNDQSVPAPDGGAGSSDPVRFGVSDIASFTPAGTASAGTVYLASAGGIRYAVRVASTTGRTRILRYAAAEGGWRAW